MVQVSRFRIKGARYVLVKENNSFFDVALSRYPVWGTAIKYFKRLKHIYIDSGILSPDTALISKLKEEELMYTMRLPIQTEEMELEVELQELDEGIRMLNIMKPQEETKE